MVDRTRRRQLRPKAIPPGGGARGSTRVAADGSVSFVHDVVVRGGTIVDGTGGPARRADLAVDDGVVTEIADDVGAGRREIDAEGRLVAPGWVDIHTHYDGQ